MTCRILRSAMVSPEHAAWRAISHAVYNKLVSFALRMDARRTAALWELVLTARRIPHVIMRSSGGFFVLVPPFYESEAIRELVAFEIENYPVQVDRPPVINNEHITMWILFGLVVLHGLRMGWWINLPYNPDYWIEIGKMDGVRALVDREWYRTVTALFLHQDSKHLFSNVIFGAPFIIPLCRRLGSGVGWLLVLLGGILGNYWNVIFQGYELSSIGSSTGLFAAVGILSGLESMRRTPDRWRRAFVPLAGGVALLAMLGGPAEGTDFGAHVFGLCAGMVLGAACALLIRFLGEPSRLLSRSAVVFVLFLFFTAWGMALN